MEKPKKPRRFFGLFSGSTSAMKEYNEQLKIYEREQAVKVPEPQEDLLQKLQKSGKEALWNSDSYNEVTSALAEFNRLTKGPVNLENTKKLLVAHEALGLACDNYLESREGARTDRGKERFTIIKSISDLQKKESTKNLRDPYIINNAKAKSYKDIMAELRTESITLTNDEVTRHGGGMSTRYQFAKDGKEGFFSEQSYVPVDKGAILGSVIEDFKLKQSYESLKRLEAAVTGDTDSMNSFIGNLVSAKAAGLDAPNLSLEERKTKISGWLMGNDHVTREVDELLGDEEGTRDFFKFMKDYTGQINLASAAEAGGIDPASEVTKRNVASSRLASLLGMDELIARSETMDLKIGDRQMKGVFMKNAEGLDINKPGHVAEMVGVTNFEHPNFQKQTSNLQIMDLIAGQLDRHTGNMIYRVAEVNKQKCVTGVEGIDNDMAFGKLTDITKNAKDKLELFGSKFGGLNQIALVDATMKDRLDKMDRASLDYAFGDILSEEEIDAMEQRLVAVKKRVGEVEVVGENDWNAATAKKLSDKTDSYYNQAKIAVSGTIAKYVSKPVVEVAVPVIEEPVVEAPTEPKTEEPVAEAPAQPKVEEPKAEEPVAEAPTEPKKNPEMMSVKEKIAFHEFEQEEHAPKAQKPHVQSQSPKKEPVKNEEKEK